MEEAKNKNWISDMIKRIPHGITLWFFYFFFISLYGPLLSLIYRPIGSLVFPYYLSFHLYLLIPVTIIASVISERYSSKWYQYMLYHLGITSLSSTIIFFMSSSTFTLFNFLILNMISIVIYLPYTVLDWFLKDPLYTKQEEETKFRKIFSYISKKLTTFTLCLIISLLLLQIFGLGKRMIFVNYSLYICFTLSFLTDFIESRIPNKPVALIVYIAGGLISSLMFIYWYSSPLAGICVSVFFIFWFADYLSRRMLWINQKSKKPDRT